MSLIGERERKQILKKFAALPNPVRLLMFTQDFECEYCSMTRQLLEEVGTVSDKLSVEVRDFVADAELAKRHGIDKIPAIAVLGDGDYGIRFYGVPAGYEFSSLLESILDVSRRDPQLSPELLAMLGKVDQPVHMQVLVTPT
jgi:glutaredoxin-like protein